MDAFRGSQRLRGCCCGESMGTSVSSAVSWAVYVEEDTRPHIHRCVYGERSTGNGGRRCRHEDREQDVRMHMAPQIESLTYIREWRGREIPYSRWTLDYDNIGRRNVRGFICFLFFFLEGPLIQRSLDLSLYGHHTSAECEGPRIVLSLSIFLSPSTFLPLCLAFTLLMTLVELGTSITLHPEGRESGQKTCEDEERE